MSMTITELNTLIREAMAEQEVADPHVLTIYVMDKIDAEQTRDALALCLPAHVRTVKNYTRGKAYKAFRQEATLSEMHRLGPARYVPDLVASVERLASSGMLAQSVFVSGEWKFLGDCTSADLRIVATSYREAAQQNLERAGLCEELADALDKSGARKLSDLLDEAA